jgi:uncharacterized iron-regulated protein
MTKRGIVGGLFLLAATGSLLLATTLFTPSDMVIRLADGSKISFEEMLTDLQGAQVVFVGELHDNMEHHRLQLRVIKGLRKLNGGIAVAMEMFTAESQPQLDAWVDGRLDQLDFIRTYYKDWQMPWPLYREILLYSRSEKLPLVGLNVDRELTTKVAKHGFESLSPKLKSQVPTGVTCDVDPVYMEFIRQAHSIHGPGDSSFRFFCEAQMVWDKSMARHLVNFLKNNPEKQIVVIAGGGHAMKRGIPRRVDELESTKIRVVMPLIPGKGGNLKEDADYLVVP